MSHVATITLEFRDPEALADAAGALGLALARDTVRFYDGTQVTGTALRLPGWQYPVVIDGEGRPCLRPRRRPVGRPGAPPPIPAGLCGGRDGPVRAGAGVPRDPDRAGRRHGPSGARPVTRHE